MSNSPPEQTPEPAERPDLPPIPDDVREASVTQNAQTESDKESETTKIPEPPSPDEVEPQTTDYTIIGGDGKEYGPVSAEDIKRWVSTEKANGRTLVRTSKDSQWQPLGQVPALSGILQDNMESTKPGKLTAIAVMTLVGGIIAVVLGVGEAIGVVASLCIPCFLIPGSIVSFLSGIFMIIQGGLLLSENPATHIPRTRITATLQIVCIISGDVINLILGILNHIFLSDKKVTAYCSSKITR